MRRPSSFQLEHNHARGWILALILVLISTVALAPNVRAGTPEYMQLAYKVGQAYEIEVVIDKSGAFTANDIEELPKPREPKLRGEIEKMVAESTTVFMYGVAVKVTPQTEYVSDGTEKYSFASLKPHQRVEISCKITDNNEWVARKVSLTNIKKSDKVKGTVTRVAVDGKAPDTLEISGINILLTPETDVNKPTSHRELSKTELFGDLAEGVVPVGLGGRKIGNSLQINGEYRHSIRNKTELDLSRRYDSNELDTEPYLRLTAAAYLNPELRAMTQVRLWKNYVLSSELDSPSTATKLEVTQAYLLAPDIANTGFAVQVGRQTFESPREWLFDDYLDAARIYFFGVTPLQFEAAAIHAVSPLNPKFKTWTDLYGKVAVRLDKYNSISAYVLSRSDTDARNREPIWWGTTYTGRIRSRLRPWASFAVMRGTDKGRSLRAYAFDLGGAYVATATQWTPSVTVGYALGSGDDIATDNTDKGFRQTGYEDNVSRFGGISKASLYGYVLQPELSNLGVLSLGAGCRPFETASIEVFYRIYRQHHAAPEMQGTGLVDPPARPNGSSGEVGNAIDIVASSPEFLNAMRFVWSFGVFNPGAAYEPRQKRATVNRVELNVRF